MTDDYKELMRLLRQTTLRVAQDTADLQVRPVFHMIRYGVVPALAIILLALGLTIGLERFRFMLRHILSSRDSWCA